MAVEALAVEAIVTVIMGVVEMIGAVVAIATVLMRTVVVALRKKRSRHHGGDQHKILRLMKMRAGEDLQPRPLVEVEMKMNSHHHLGAAAGVQQEAGGKQMMTKSGHGPQRCGAILSLPRRQRTKVMMTMISRQSVRRRAKPRKPLPQNLPKRRMTMDSPP